MRTRYVPPGYPPDRLEPTKDEVREALATRVRAHIRAAMIEHGWGIQEAAAVLGEDKGALHYVLVKGREPSPYLIFRVQERLGVKPWELLNETPPEQYIRDDRWAPQAREQKYPLRKRRRPPPPSAASPEAALPRKRTRSRGGG